jgi:hypothetical protein
VGAKQCSTAFIEQVITEIVRDPLARAIYMGDGGECVTKNSKGNVFEQTMSPGDQLRTVADYMAPIKDKLLFGIRGNHGNRIDKETGIGWDEMLCARVGIPYLGVSAFGDLVLHLSKTSKVAISLYCHHGSTSSVTPAGKMSAGHKPETIVLADLALTAHVHTAGECWPPRHLFFTDPRSGRLKQTTMRMYVCGTAYDSRSGYAEEKMYAYILPQHIVVSVAAKYGRANVAEKVITHRTIDGFSEDYVIPEEAEKWRIAA